MIFTLETPIVSAVGHEIDYCISDFVSDHRSLTPTAAMVDLLPDANTILQSLDIAFDKFESFIDGKFQNSFNILNC